MKTSQIQVISMVACLFLSAATAEARRATKELVEYRDLKDLSKPGDGLMVGHASAKHLSSLLPDGQKDQTSSLYAQIKQVQNEILRAAINISEAHNGPEERRPMPGSARWKELEVEHTSRLDNKLKFILRAEEKILAVLKEQEDDISAAL